MDEYDKITKEILTYLRDKKEIKKIEEPEKESKEKIDTKKTEEISKKNGQQKGVIDLKGNLVLNYEY